MPVHRFEIASQPTQRASRKRWRRRGWVTVERRLLKVCETVLLRSGADYMSMIPAELPPEFLTSDIANALGCRRHLAQKVAYCLKNGGLIEKVGSQGNAIVYAKVRRDSRSTSSVPADSEHGLS